MALRLIDIAKPFGPFGKPGRVVKIHYGTDTQEYRCRVYDNGKAVEELDYFTDDRSDAENTACVMLG